MKPEKRGKKRTDQLASNKKDSLNGSGHDARHRIAETAYERYEQLELTRLYRYPRPE